MDKDKLNHELVKLVAYYMDIRDQINEGVQPYLVDGDRWLDRYRGKQYHDRALIHNTFRHGVDYLVYRIMDTVDKCDTRI